MIKEFVGRWDLGVYFLQAFWHDAVVCRLSVVSLLTPGESNLCNPGHS